jgi:hypothetical protein
VPDKKLKGAVYEVNGAKSPPSGERAEAEDVAGRIGSARIATARWSKLAFHAR